MDVNKILQVLADDRNVGPGAKVAVQMMDRRAGLGVENSHGNADVLSGTEGLIRRHCHSHSANCTIPTRAWLERDRGARSALHLQIERLNPGSRSQRCEVGEQAIVAAMRKYVRHAEDAALRRFGMNMVELRQIARND